MQYGLCVLAFCGLILDARLAWAQEIKPPSKTIKTEDQMLAEAMWRIAGFDVEDDLQADAAFREVSETYPNSAKVAYWHATFRSYENQQIGVMQKIAEASETLAEQMKVAALSGSVSDKQILMGELFARDQQQQLQIRLEQWRANHAADSWESMMIKAVSLDPKLTAGWSALMESDNAQTVKYAYEAWRALEPDNSLPYYVRAFALAEQSLSRKESDGLDPEVLEFLEQGNRRKLCLGSAKPWPQFFTLRYGNKLPESLTGKEGMLIDPPAFGSYIQNRFDNLGAIGGSSDSVSRDKIEVLKKVILRHSHSMGFDYEVRCWRAFIELGLHLCDSNQAMYAAYSTEMTEILRYLENLATQHGDFTHANQYFQIRNHFWQIRRALYDAWWANAEVDLFNQELRDQTAHRIMSSMRKELDVPPIERLLPSNTLPVISMRDDDAEADMVRFDLHWADREYYVNVNEPDPVGERWRSEELEDRGYLTLHAAIDQVQMRNRDQKRRCGVVVYNDLYLAGDDYAIYDCFDLGYWGKDSLCIFASHLEKPLRRFRKRKDTHELRLAQIIDTGPMLTKRDQAHFSQYADLLIIPYHRVLDETEQVLPWLRDSQWKLILADIPRDQIQRFKSMEFGGCVAGLALAEEK